jgi:CRP/FNR family transcriptional regulator, cyclic AMP receptor protein
MQLSEAEALVIVSVMKPCRFPSGTTIIRQGDADNNGFMVQVLEGEIAVENQIGHRPNPVTVNILGPGSLVGEMALVDGAARSATCPPAPTCTAPCSPARRCKPSSLNARPRAPNS